MLNRDRPGVCGVIPHVDGRSYALLRAVCELALAASAGGVGRCHSTRLVWCGLTVLELPRLVAAPGAGLLKPCREYLRGSERSEARP
jgi:hypothetical protein